MNLEKIPKQLMWLSILVITTIISFIIVLIITPEIWSVYVYFTTTMWMVAGLSFYAVYFFKKKNKKTEGDNNDWDEKLIDAKDQLALHYGHYAKIIQKLDEIKVRIFKYQNRLDSDDKKNLDDDEREFIENEIGKLKKDERALYQIEIGFRTKVLTPRKSKSKEISKITLNEEFGVYEANDELLNDDGVMHDIAKIKWQIRKQEQLQVGEFIMPFVSSLVFFGVFLILLIVTTMENDTNSIIHSLTGDYSTLILYLMGIALIVYMKSSIKKVPANNQAVFFWMNKAFFSMGRGTVFVPKYLANIIIMPTSKRWYNLSPDDVIMTGKEGQSVMFDLSIPWHIKDVWDVIAEIGLNYYDVVVPFLEGGKIVEGEVSVLGGAIGDTVNNAIRNYVADADKVGTIDEALNVRGPIIDVVGRELKDEFSQMGIGFGEVKIPHILPQQDVLHEMNESARQTKRSLRVAHENEANILEAEGIADVAVKTAEGSKQSDILRAEGERKSVILRAEGLSKEIEKKGLAEAQVDKAKLSAELQALIDTLGDRDEAKEILPLLYALKAGEKVAPELIKSLSNLKMTMVSVDGVDKINNLIKSLGSFFTSSGGE